MTLDPTNLETGENDPAAEGQTSDAEKTVPFAAYEAERKKRQDAEEKATLYMAQLRMGLAQPPAQQPTAQAKSDELFAGLDDDEPLTVKEVRAAFNTVTQKMDARVGAMTDEAQFLARHPDYEEVITKHLPTLFEEDPGLLQRLQRNPDPYIAYKLGVASPSYQAKKAKERIAKDDKGKTAQANAQKPGSASQVGGATGQHPGDKFANMKRDEFRAHMEKVKRGGR